MTKNLRQPKGKRTNTEETRQIRNNSAHPQFDPQSQANTSNSDDVHPKQKQTTDPIVIPDEEEDLTTLTCSVCDSVLECTKSMFDDFILMHHKEIDDLMIRKMREHFDYLDSLKVNTSVQCQRIGKTSDWRQFWPLKSKSVITVVSECQTVNNPKTTANG